MPYRVDVRAAGADAADRLIELGALDVDATEHGVSAIMPDAVTAAAVADALERRDVTVSRAAGRDAGSVWMLRQRARRIGSLNILPADAPPEQNAVRLIDDTAFGTGWHPTTALCIEAIADSLQAAIPAAMLDVGTGSGVLALAALMMGVAHATAIDIAESALRVADTNARLNGVADRLTLTRGGPDVLSGAWLLVCANVLAAPLVEMAPTLVRRISHHGELILSGIPASAEPDVVRAYRHLGMRHARTLTQAGWVALVFRATW